MTSNKFILIVIVFSVLVGCSRPKAGICSTCPLWWVDPICLSGGDVPDPPPLRKAPPPAESDLVPGQENSTYKK